MARLLAFVASAFLAVSSAQAANITTTAPGASGMIFVEGEMVESDGARFVEAAKRFKTATVSLESGGGNLIGGIAMGAEIRRRGFSTVVPNGATCASVCATVWLSGVERSAGGSSRIGFHSSYLIVDGKPQPSPEGNEYHSRYLRSIGVSETTISYIMMAAPGSMTWLTDAAAKSVGIRYASLGGTGPAATTLPPKGAMPVVYRDLKVRAAIFTKPAKGSDSCRMVVHADGDIDGHAFATIDIPRRGGAAPAVTFQTGAMHADGQPRVVSVEGELYELDRGASSGSVPADRSRALVRDIQAHPAFHMVALRPDGTTATYRFGTEGLRTAMDRAAKACGQA